MSSRQTTSCYSGLSVCSQTIALLPAVASSVGWYRIAGLLRGVYDVAILQPSHQTVASRITIGLWLPVCVALVG
jgi:hypothetical protein